MAVPIQRLLKEAVFDPDEVARLVAAYESALKLLRPKDRTDPVKELVAKKIIEVSRSGEPDPAKVCAQALLDLGLPLRN
jgi:hypothetical protein